jgi:hypothetical protein
VRKVSGWGAAMIVATSATIQLSGALAHVLCSQIGLAGVSALRFALSALILLVVVRPTMRGRIRAIQLADGSLALPICDRRGATPAGAFASCLLGSGGSKPFAREGYYIGTIADAMRSVIGCTIAPRPAPNA